MRVTLCDKKRCRNLATQAFDVHPSCGRVREPRHYEICDKHAAEFFGDGGFITDTRSERIKSELVPS